jgi:hypothetical protein
MRKVYLSCGYNRETNYTPDQVAEIDNYPNCVVELKHISEINVGDTVLRADGHLHTVSKSDKRDPIDLYENINARIRKEVRRVTFVCID